MSFGLSVENDSGSVILDTFYPQMPFLYSGSATGTGLALNVSTQVSFPASIANPILAVRTRNLNIWLLIVVVNNDSFYFKADVGEVIDWKVFDGSGSAWPSESGYGMCIYSDSGNIIYNTNTNQPFIKSVQTVLTSTQITAPGTANDVYIRTLTVPFTAYDGGLPFVFASALTPASILANPGSLVRSTALKWTSSSTVDFYWKNITSTGPPGPGSQTYVFNTRPRLAFFIR
jgi:hypothetical protein